MVGRPPVLLTGPLEESGVRFAAWLAGSALCYVNQERAWREFVRFSIWLAGQGLDTCLLNEDMVDQYWIGKCERVGSRLTRQHVQVVKRFLACEGLIVLKPPRSRSLGGVPRLREGPLAEVLPRMPEWLAGRGYAPGTALSMADVTANLSRWLGLRHVRAGEITVTLLECFAAEQSAHGRTSAVKRMSVVAAFLSGSGLMVPESKSPSADGELDLWAEYLRSARGLSPAWIRESVLWVEGLIESITSEDDVNWDVLTPRLVSDYVASRGRGYSAGSVRHLASAVRSLLKWAVATGRVDQEMSAAVLAPKRPAAGLPKALSRDQVDRLLGAVDQSGPGGLRDYAVILLLVRLGLRAGEAAGIRLDDIDWRAGTIRVWGKGRGMVTPLPSDVGETLVAYLRGGRPAGALDRHLFIRYRAPWTKMSVSGLSCIVARAAQRAGIGVIRAHRLRHTAATNVINRGGSLAEAGQLLGHTTMSSTAVYARVDMTSLRQLVIAWPGGQP